MSRRLIKAEIPMCPECGAELRTHGATGEDGGLLGRQLEQLTASYNLYSDQLERSIERNANLRRTIREVAGEMRDRASYWAVEPGKAREAAHVLVEFANRLDPQPGGEEG